MGDVYEAYDTTKDRTVALKILRPELSCDERFRSRFQRESHAAAMLEDPHVIPIYDWGEIGGSLYIDMRLVRGQDLHELLRRGPLEPARAVGIIRQVASALDAAHARGLIHRDIKPQNILLTSADDFAYLIDFGIAQNLADTRLTTEGSAVGSVAYMAPERFEDRPTTAAVDVYSLAAVLYEMLTGEVPFRANGLEQVIAAHTSLPPPRPSLVNPRLPAAFDDVIARGMAKDPDDRFGTAGGLGRAAQRAVDGTSSPGSDSGPFAKTRQAPPGYRGSSAGDAGPFRPQGQPGPQGSNRPRPWLVPAAIVMGAVLLAGVGVIIGLLVQQNHVTSPTPGIVRSNSADKNTGAEVSTPGPTASVWSNSAPPISSTPSSTNPTVAPMSLTGNWSGPVSGDQTAFDVVADIVDGAQLTGTVSYPQLNCAGIWKGHGSTANGIRLLTETITQGDCVTSEITLAPQNDGTLYFTSTYYAASKQRHITIYATLHR
jgi:serine/threonine protein kinase